MEVSGRKTGEDQKKSSGVESNSTNCQPCSETGKHVAAKRFCRNCNEYLCGRCIDDHQKFKQLRNHKLVNIPENTSPLHKCHVSNPTIPCNKHEDKFVEFYCRAHNVTVCGACAVLDHTSCKPEYIPDISAGYQDSKEYKRLKDNLDKLQKSITDVCEQIVQYKEKTENSGKDAVDKIRKFREEINNFLKQKESELVAEVEAMRNKDLQILNKAQADCDDMATKLTDMNTKVTKLEEDSSDLFIQCNQMSSQLNQITDHVNKLCNSNHWTLYFFTPAKAAEDMLLSKKAMGTIERKDCKDNPVCDLTGCGEIPTDWSNCQLSRQSDIPANVSTDRLACRITGMTFNRPNSLLLTDYNNTCIKRVDMTSGNVTASLHLSSRPWDITTLGPDQAAVTLLSKQKIQIICTKPDLSLVRTIKVNGYCHGIDSTVDNKLIVSYIRPRKVEVMDDQGTVLRTIGTDTRGQSLFTNPAYVCDVLEDSQEVIYVSDHGTSTITKLSMTGQVLFTYTDEDLTCPRGPVATCDGHILVCGESSHNVQVVSTNGNKICTLLSAQDGISEPYSVCFITERNILYVSCSDGSIKVFKT